jgi:hypothetical protein
MPVPQWQCPSILAACRHLADISSRTPGKFPIHSRPTAIAAKLDRVRNANDNEHADDAGDDRQV